MPFICVCYYYICNGHKGQQIDIYCQPSQPWASSQQWTGPQQRTGRPWASGQASGRQDWQATGRRPVLSGLRPAGRQDMGRRPAWPQAGRTWAPAGHGQDMGTPRGPVLERLGHRAAAAVLRLQVEGRLLLDVLVRDGAAVLQLLPSEDQPLLVQRNPLLVLKGGMITFMLINQVGNSLPGAWP